MVAVADYLCLVVTGFVRSSTATASGKRTSFLAVTTPPSPCQSQYRHTCTSSSSCSFTWVREAIKASSSALSWSSDVRLANSSSLVHLLPCLVRAACGWRAVLCERLCPHGGSESCLMPHPLPPSALKSTIAIMEDGFIGAHPFMEETKDEDEEGDGTWEQMAEQAGTLYMLMAHCCHCRLAARSPSAFTASSALHPSIQPCATTVALKKAYGPRKPVAGKAAASAPGVPPPPSPCRWQRQRQQRHHLLGRPGHRPRIQAVGGVLCGLPWAEEGQASHSQVRGGTSICHLRYGNDLLRDACVLQSHGRRA